MIWAHGGTSAGSITKCCQHVRDVKSMYSRRLQRDEAVLLDVDCMAMHSVLLRGTTVHCAMIQMQWHGTHSERLVVRSSDSARRVSKTRKRPCATGEMF